ncbi:MAG: hemerythrin domain-containing protein [bacterium]
MIRDLRTDHHNILRVLRLLKRSLATMDGKLDSKEFERARECIKYLCEYPDSIHHPREDLMFEMLLNREPSVTDKVGNLHQEHIDLYARSKQLHDALESAEAGMSVAIDVLQHQARGFSDMQISHMRHEELSVFPLIEQKLTLNDWKSIIAKAPAGRDPVFSAKPVREGVSGYQVLTKYFRKEHVG